MFWYLWAVDILDQVLARAAADLGVRGVILTGSRARGTETALFPAVEILARCNGHAEVLEGWGSDIELIRAFADAAVADRS